MSQVGPQPVTRLDWIIFRLTDVQTRRNGPTSQRHSLRKVQFPLDCLEAWLFPQGVQKLVGLQELQARITQPHGGVKPLERLGQISPLCIDRGVLVGARIALRCLELLKLSFRIGVPSELVIDDRQALLSGPEVPLGLA